MSIALQLILCRMNQEKRKAAIGKISFCIVRAMCFFMFLSEKGSFSQTTLFACSISCLTTFLAAQEMSFNLFLKKKPRIGSLLRFSCPEKSCHLTHSISIEFLAVDNAFYIPESSTRRRLRPEIMELWSKRFKLI